MNILNDLRHAVRSLTRVKGLTLTVVVTLALGIGANAAIFTIVRGVLLAPFHNMSLFSPFHTQADVDAHTTVFRAAVEALVG